MMYLFTAGVLLVFFINFETIGLMLKKSSESFEKNKKYGTAEVVGYDSSEQSRWYSLIVKVYDLNDDKTYICNSSKIDIHNYPKGTVVNVVYANCKFAGKDTIKVNLEDKPPADKNSISKVFKILGYIILLASIITFGIGIVAII